MSDARDLPPATALGSGGRYVLGEPLGSGGAASVYRAHDQLLGRDVAVKVLHEHAAFPAGSALDEDARPDPAYARFASEARTLASLDHPHLVGLLDAGFGDDHPFLVMQLVEGSTLLTRIASHGDPGLAAVLVRRVGAQVADALAYTHERGVVHRDVKPANILLSGEGDEVRAALADFGIARLVDNVDATRHTASGLTIGTAAYLAPEQVRGTEVGPAADVYALGLTLLEAFTGVRAYPGTAVESAVARLQAPPVVPEDLGAQDRDLLTAMTSLEPEDRPSAAEAARRFATDAPEHTAVLAAADLPVTQVVELEPARRRWVVPGLLAGGALVVALALVVAGLGGSDAKDSPQPTAPSASSTPQRTPSSDATAAAAVTPSPTPSSPTTQPAPAQPAVGPAQGPGKGPGPKKPKKDKGKGPGKP